MDIQIEIECVVTARWSLRWVWCGSLQRCPWETYSSVSPLSMMSTPSGSLYSLLLCHQVLFFSLYIHTWLVCPSWWVICICVPHQSCVSVWRRVSACVCRWDHPVLPLLHCGCCWTMIIFCTPFWKMNLDHKHFGNRKFSTYKEESEYLSKQIEKRKFNANKIKKK